jgi:hypothetical protein
VNAVNNFDEWVRINRIKIPDVDRISRIGESLAVLSFALSGAVIATYFYATRKHVNPGDRVEQVVRTTPQAL